MESGKKERCIDDFKSNLADILVPKFGPGADERLHEIEARRVVKDRHLDPAGAQQRLLAHEAAVLPDDHPRDPVKEDRAGTHRARRKSGVERAVAVNAGRLAAGVLQGVHFAVENGTALLDASIVAAADDLALVGDDAANRNAALGQTTVGFLNCCLHQRVHRWQLAASAAKGRALAFFRGCAFVVITVASPKPMPTVRLAGTVRGEKDPNREIRAVLLYQLFSKGWDIYNSNGDQRISLSNIERKIIESEAFVFTPGATLEDVFKAVSIFVGYQTLDRHLAGKPTVILNSDGSWDAVFNLLVHLNLLGTVKQNHADYLLLATEVGEVIELLEKARAHGLPDVGRERSGLVAGPSFETPLPANIEGSICVFCSATIEDPAYLADGYQFGMMLAEASFGCVSGAGNSGIMGEVVRGAVDRGGWTGGSNVPHIIELEGLPDGLSSFWLRPDIYTRMEVMIERSQAFVIFPGGAGTVQEMLALMIFKHQKNPLMEGKPVVVFNREDADGECFWDPLVEMLTPWCAPDEFVVVNDLAEIIPTVRRLMTTPTPV
jgi:uncharacterized protein (TIGR00730 family)